MYSTCLYTHSVLQLLIKQCNSFYPNIWVNIHATATVPQVPSEDWGVGYSGGGAADSGGEIPCRRMRSGSYIKAMGDDDSADSDTSPKASPKSTLIAQRDAFRRSISMDQRSISSERAIRPYNCILVEVTRVQQMQLASQIHRSKVVCTSHEIGRSELSKKGSGFSVKQWVGEKKNFEFTFIFIVVAVCFISASICAHIILVWIDHRGHTVLNKKRNRSFAMMLNIF